MKKLLYILAACLVLSGCADDAQSSSDEAVTTTTSATTEADNSSVPDETSKPEDKPNPKPEKMAITAEVLSYKSGMLTFKYDDKEYSLPIASDKFDNDHSEHPCLSERIINNKLGETVYAKISVKPDMSEIFICDVVNMNGKELNAEWPTQEDENGKEYVDESLIYTLKRKEGSLCELSNNYNKFEFDLNDLPFWYRYDYPEVVKPVHFNYYKFKDGKTFITKIYPEFTLEGKTLASDINYFSHDGILAFFGVIQSITDDGKTMTVQLNDKKTLCTMPTYYNDGELKEGMEIMAALRAESSLFGSGGEHEFDYAVIYTDAEYYNQTGFTNRYADDYLTERIEFDELAYAKYAGSSHFSYTKIKDVERQNKEG